MEGVDLLLNKKNEYSANNITELVISSGNKIVQGQKTTKRDRGWRDINSVGSGCTVEVSGLDLPIGGEDPPPFLL